MQESSIRVSDVRDSDIREIANNLVDHKHCNGCVFLGLGESIVDDKLEAHCCCRRFKLLTIRAPKPPIHVDLVVRPLRCPVRGRLAE
jgi:hypothetical protein